MTLSLVSTTTVGATSVKTITLSAIPQTGTDLYLTISSRDTGTISSGYQPINVYLENPGAVNGGKRLMGNGSSASSDAPSYLTPVSVDATMTANTFSNNAIYICNYTTTGRKPMSLDGVAEHNGNPSFQGIQSGLSEGGSAITQIQLSANGNFSQYTTVSLYTITKGSGGATVA